MTADVNLRETNSNARPPADQRALVAVDLGAESCRVSLLRWINGEARIQIVHRFENGPISEGKDLRWDIRRIRQGLEEGLRLCAAIAEEGIAAIGVDGWAVDYVRLNASGQPVANPFCYRDQRTQAAQKQVHEHISPERLYALTGVQILPFNTLYQLRADDQSGTDQNIPWTNLPEYILSWLGGKRVSEYTNATHTALLGVSNQEWSTEIFAAAGLALSAAPLVVPSGSRVGQLQGPLTSLRAFRDTALIAPACHDTASAIAGIPAHGDDWAFISSGTWSLVGCVLDAPCVENAAREKNFSNEGGIGGKIYFLKNINGMWLLRQCIDSWKSQGQSWTVEQLVDACAALPAPQHLLDVDDPDFLTAGNMLGKINAQFARSGKPLVAENSENASQVANLIFHSLAARYAAVLQDISVITSKRFKRLYIVGGGSKNALLNHLTRQATGIEVQTASSESTTIGNFAIQLATLAADYVPSTGVQACSVAEWAGIVGHRPIETADIPGTVYSH